MEQNPHFIFSERDLEVFKKSKKESKNLIILGIVILVISTIILPMFLYINWENIVHGLNQGVEEKILEEELRFKAIRPETELENTLLKKAQVYLQISKLMMESIWVVVACLLNSALFTAGVGSICTGHSMRKVLKVVNKYIE